VYATITLACVADVTAVSLLGYTEKITWSAQSGHTVVTLPASAKPAAGFEGYAFKLTGSPAANC
jgi:hypothetical protein